MFGEFDSKRFVGLINNRERYLKTTDAEIKLIIDQSQFLIKELFEEGAESGLCLEKHELQGDVKLYEEYHYDEEFSIVPYIILDVQEDNVTVLALKKRK